MIQMFLSKASSYAIRLVLMLVLVLLQLDIPALMGLAGAVFRDFFGTTTGVLIALGSMTLWMALPVLAGYRTFLAKDF